MASEVLANRGPALGYLPCVHNSSTFWRAYVGAKHVANVSFQCEPERSLNVTLLCDDFRMNSSEVTFVAAGQQPIAR